MCWNATRATRTRRDVYKRQVVDLDHERDVLEGLLHHVGVGPLRGDVAVGDPHEVDLGGLVLADPLTEARHGNGLVLNSIGVGLIGRAAGHQGGGAAGVVHAVAAMADMTAEQGQIHLGLSLIHI